MATIHGSFQVNDAFARTQQDNSNKDMAAYLRMLTERSDLNPGLPRVFAQNLGYYTKGVYTAGGQTYEWDQLIPRMPPAPTTTWNQYRALLFTLKTNGNWALIHARLPHRTLLLYQVREKDPDLEVLTLLVPILNKRIDGYNSRNSDEWTMMEAKTPPLRTGEQSRLLMCKLADEVATAQSMGPHARLLGKFQKEMAARLYIHNTCRNVMASTYDEFDCKIISNILKELPQPIGEEVVGPRELPKGPPQIFRRQIVGRSKAIVKPRPRPRPRNKRTGDGRTRQEGDGQDLANPGSAVGKDAATSTLDEPEPAGPETVPEEKPMDTGSIKEEGEEDVVAPESRSA